MKNKKFFALFVSSLSMAVIAGVACTSLNRNNSLFSRVTAGDNPYLLELTRSLNADELSAGQATFNTSNGNPIVFKFDSEKASSSVGLIDLETDGVFYNETLISGITKIEATLSGGSAVLNYGDEIGLLNLGSESLDTSGADNVPFTVTFSTPADYFRITDVVGPLTINDFKITYSCSVENFDESKVLSTVAPIGDWIKSDFDFGLFQYGGENETTTSCVSLLDASKSKEFDGSYRRVSISGSGSTTDRIYSIYFKLGSHMAALGINAPKAITFWVYNEVIGGGLLFKANGEITSGIKTYNSDGSFVGRNNRNLDFVGFRRYVISLSPTNLAASELEIGIFGASTGTVVDYSAFGFIDNTREMVKLGKVSDFTFNSWDQDYSSMTNGVVDTQYTVDSDGKAYKLARGASDNWSAANIYLQKENLLDGLNVAMIKFVVYNNIYVGDYEHNGLSIHFGNYGDEVNAMTVYQSLDFTGFRTYAFLVTSENLTKSELHINIWGVAAAEIFISGFEVLNVK